MFDFEVISADLLFNIIVVEPCATHNDLFFIVTGKWINKI